MFLIVGLGNPGEEYEHTRHNAGFDTVDKIASEIGVRYWKNECGALTGKGAYHDIDVVLAKPQSYMNTSGGPVKQLMNAYGVSPDHLVVIHDELDIDPGTIRVKFGGGHAGHNGLRSICDKLGTRGSACAAESGARRDACRWPTMCCPFPRRTRRTTSRRRPIWDARRHCSSSSMGWRRRSRNSTSALRWCWPDKVARHR